MLSDLHLLTFVSKMTVNMENCSGAIMPTGMPDNNRSLFMELPTEVREMILRFLLVAPHTRLGYEFMRAKEVSRYVS